MEFFAIFLAAKASPQGEAPPSGEGANGQNASTLSGEEPFLTLPPSVREVSHKCDGRRVLIKTNKTLAFCQKGTSTMSDRKMRPRRRPRLRLTQAACYRVSSSCRQYEVFGNFAWRSAPPRKRVAQLGKAPDCETERCPLPVAVAVGPAGGGTAIGEPP